MEEFLRERGLQESVIEKFQCDGIDATVITLMTDEELKHYLPRFGDQIAIKAFARQELQKSQNTESDKRRSLREKLISKLQKKHSSSEHLKRSESQRGNVNAKKMSRKIELGWLHQYGFNGSLKQVRSASGGGTRTVAIQLDCLIGDVLPVAKDLFFPDGISKKGTVDEFDFHIADQTQTRLSPHLKIQELYERTKLKRVRLYMVTCSPGFFSSDGTEAADNETRAGTNETRAGTVDQVDSLVGEMQEKNDKRVETAEKETTRRSVEQVDSMVTELQGKNDKHVEAAENETTRRSVELVDSVLGKLEERNDECVETTGNETTRSTVEQVGSMVTELHEMNDKHVEAADDMHILDEHGETFSNGSVPSVNISEPGEMIVQGYGEDNDSLQNYLPDFVRQSEDQDLNTLPAACVVPNTIRIHRAVILNELIPIFKDPVITTKPLQFIFVDEKGHDSQGLSRDAYAVFWEAFCLKYTDGEDFRIPILSNELGDTEWEAVGRILLKGYMDLKYFPVNIAPAFFVAVCHGEGAVTPEILKNSFLSFLSATEKDLLGHALSEVSFDLDELVELLDRFDCHCIPNKDNLSCLVLQISHRVLIQEPKYAMDALQRVGQIIWREEFPSVDMILSMYAKSEPTVPKVLALFSANPMSKEQNESFKYLQKFVRGRNKEQLRQLLRFLTGSDMLCVSQIDVSFVVRYGAGRVPTAHTCGPVLELPCTYVSYPDFRNEWESILQAKENMNMMIA